MTISFGDSVKILNSDQTDEAGLAGLIGEVLGETSPSSTGVTFFGDAKDDYVINVEFQDINAEYWFTPELLELIEQDNKPKANVDSPKYVKPKKWWQFWS